MSRYPQIPDPVGPSSIYEFATSPHYLGKTLSVLQGAILKAAYGEELTREELLEFVAVTEGRRPRPGGYDEIFVCGGIRSGKTDRLAATSVAYEVVRWGPVMAPLLAPGQTVKVILIAQDDRGADELRGYIEGNLQTLEDPSCGCGCHWDDGILAKTTGQERAITGEAIKTRWPVEIKVYPPKRNAVRATTALCGICDEIAHWETGEGAYNQDTKVIKAFRGRFATLARLRPKKWFISSPFDEEGFFFKEYEKRGDSKALWVQATSWELNPTLDQEMLDKEQEKDPEAFVVEYGAKFSKGGAGNTFLDPRIVDQCVDRGVIRRKVISGMEYISWMDAAFKRDRFSISIGHVDRSKDTAVVYQDACRHWTPQRSKGHKPLDDDEIIREIVEDFLLPFGIDRIHGDQHCDVFLAKKFEQRGIKFILKPTSKPEKFEAYKNLRAALKMSQVRLLDDEITIRDLKGLVRHETKDGYTVSAQKRRSSYDDASTPVSRIVQALLPMIRAVDLSALNAKAIQRDPRGYIDWRDPDRATGELDPFSGESIMETVL